MLQLLQRLNDRGKGRLFHRRQLLDPGTATLQQLAHAGLDVLGANTREGRQGLVAQERIFHAGSQAWGYGAIVPRLMAQLGRSGRPNGG